MITLKRFFDEQKWKKLHYLFVYHFPPFAEQENTQYNFIVWHNHGHWAALLHKRFLQYLLAQFNRQ